MGHAVLHVKDINDAVPFYRDVLGFRLSDYMVGRSTPISSMPIRATTRSPSSRPAATPPTI